MPRRRNILDQKPGPDAEPREWIRFRGIQAIQAYLDRTGIDLYELARKLNRPIGSLRNLIYKASSLRTATLEDLGKFAELDADRNAPIHGRAINYVYIVTGREKTKYEEALEKRLENAYKEIEDRDERLQNLRNFIEKGG